MLPLDDLPPSLVETVLVDVLLKKEGSDKTQSTRLTPDFLPQNLEIPTNKKWLSCSLGS